MRGSEAVGGSLAWRCTARNSLIDPCWVAAVEPRRGSTVICMGHPWSAEAFRIDVARRLPFNGRPSEQRRFPWAVQLTNGLRCDAYQGAHSAFRDRPVDYYCGDPNRPRLVLLRGPARSDSLWNYDSAFQTAKGYAPGPTVGVRVAWFGG
jgi:hypothetical protein